MSRISVVKGAIEAVARLAERGIRRAVISNSTFTSATLEWQLDALGFAELFEFVMSSGDFVVQGGTQT